MLAQVTQQEQKWLEQEIDHYRIVVLPEAGVWYAQPSGITAEDGEEVPHSASCVLDPTEDDNWEF